MVDERGPVDASFLRIAQHGVNTFLLECGNEPLLVIRALQYGKDGALRHVGEFSVLDFRF